MFKRNSHHERYRDILARNRCEKKKKQKKIEYSVQNILMTVFLAMGGGEFLYFYSLTGIKSVVFTFLLSIFLHLRC